uniref:Glutaredoxin family protein n=1 Tax=Dictyoglomus thermophilum TaxID=14 RepID=A0A7C3MIJ3_DICTH
MMNMPRVIVYSTSSCPWCNAAKRYLRERGIRFYDVDVSKDKKAAEEMVRKSGQMGVPVIDINGHIIVGFDRAKIDRLLGLK